MYKKILAILIAALSVIAITTAIGTSPASAESCRIPSKTGHYLYRATPEHYYSYRPTLLHTEGCVEVHISDTGRYWRWDGYAMLTDRSLDTPLEKTCYVWDTPGNGFNPVERVCDRVYDRNWARVSAVFDRYIHGDPNSFRHFGVQYDKWGYSREWHEINDYYYAWNQ